MMNMQPTISGDPAAELACPVVTFHDSLADYIPAPAVVKRVAAFPAPVALARLIAGLTRARTMLQNILAHGLMNKAAMSTLYQADSTAADEYTIEKLFQDNELAWDVLDKNYIVAQATPSASLACGMPRGPDRTALFSKYLTAKRAFDKCLVIVAALVDLLQDNQKAGDVFDGPKRIWHNFTSVSDSIRRNRLGAGRYGGRLFGCYPSPHNISISQDRTGVK